MHQVFEHVIRGMDGVLARPCFSLGMAIGAYELVRCWFAFPNIVRLCFHLLESENRVTEEPAPITR